MATVIDQAKYLDEVQIYWTDVEDSILVGDDNLSIADLAVISEERLQKLKDMYFHAENLKVFDVFVAVNESQQHLGFFSILASSQSEKGGITFTAFFYVPGFILTFPILIA